MRLNQSRFSFELNMTTSDFPEKSPCSGQRTAAEMTHKQKLLSAITSGRVAMSRSSS